MFKNTFLLIIVLFLSSCSKNSDEHIVKYLITDATTKVYIEYKNSDGEIVELSKYFDSEEDSWTYSLSLREGEMFFVSAYYLESNASAKALVLVDGKLVKEKKSENEPEKYIIVSGTVPY